MSLELELIQDDDRWKRVENIDFICANIARTLSSKLSYSQPVQAAVLLTDDTRLFELNAQFRNQQKATNVLSFPSGDNEPDPDTGNIYLGDIAISFDTVSKEAEEANKPLKNHLMHMFVHGVLHLSGYDHETDQEADEMEQLETEILKEFGVPDPYEAS
ncbi:MAG: rRNA maturation RNase YbeY [Hyphomicrobiales bacterium]